MLLVIAFFLRLQYACAVGREIQCSLLEQEQAIRPDEFSVEAPRPEKARSSKGKEDPDR